FEMDKLNMTDILQYYGMYASVYITLFSSIFAIMLSSNILAKEEADKTIEFLLARPVSRAEVVTGKLLNYLFYIFILNIIITIVSYISLEVLKKDNYSLQVFLILALASFLAQLTFANLGFLISLFIKNKKSINSIGIGLVLGMYFLGVVSRISDKIIFLSYFTPFQYASPSDIISEGRIKLAYIIIIAIVNIASIAGTYFVYNKRDINV
ncbi:MAG: ABC transporter permease subunit, partial [Halanaerobiales bacterium]